MAVKDIRVTSPAGRKAVASAPQGNFGTIRAQLSWRLITPHQEVGETDRDRARAAGRRAVEKYGEALERLAD